MDKIHNIWFDESRIYMRTDGGDVYSRPLEAFPALKDASVAERNNYTIGVDGDDVHWDDVDEDIHISSFFKTQEPNEDNEVAHIFRRFPQLDVAEVAKAIGIHKTLLAKYIYGINKPSEKRMGQIRSALHLLGKELACV